MNDLDAALRATYQARSHSPEPPALLDEVLAIPDLDIAQEHRWLPLSTVRFQSMFSATKLVIAGAVVALFGGFVLIAQPSDRQGGSLPGAANGEGSMAPALFTMRLEDGQGGDVGTKSVTEEGYTLVTGQTSFARVLDPTDPRMGGVYTSEANYVERDDGYPGLLTILYEIRNDGGRWVGTSHSVEFCFDRCPDSPAADFPAATSIVFTGMDGYDGLTAYVVAANGWTADGRTASGGAYSPDDGLPIVGLIIPGEMPRAYELQVSMCTDQYTESQCEWQQEWIDGL